MNKISQLLVCSALLLPVACAEKQADLGTKVEQVSINRVDQMPDLPETIQILDWKAKALSFDSFVFDWNN
ncbi:MAG: hypothetical protein LUD74_07580, partial [Tannerellaceae bacterium]|nr:hypothetical protein [Tannerellaceae bacterium]